LFFTVALGYIGVLSEKVDESIEVLEIVTASKRLYGLARFTLYSISDGLSAIFNKSFVGISSFFIRPLPSLQLALPCLV